MEFQYGEYTIRVVTNNVGHWMENRQLYVKDASSEYKHIGRVSQTIRFSYVQTIKLAQESEFYAAYSVAQLSKAKYAPDALLKKVKLEGIFEPKYDERGYPLGGAFIQVK